jgi:hypothetical protein
VRDELLADQRVDPEAERLVADLEPMRAEPLPKLHVGARDRDDDAPGELRRDRPVHVAGDEPPHLRMALEHGREPGPARPGRRRRRRGRR